MLRLELWHLMPQCCSDEQLRQLQCIITAAEREMVCSMQQGVDRADASFIRLAAASRVSAGTQFNRIIAASFKGRYTI